MTGQLSCDVIGCDDANGDWLVVMSFPGFVRLSAGLLCIYRRYRQLLF